MAELWLQVTSDKYELPLIVADSVEELARMTGNKVQSIRSYICHAAQFGTRCKFQRVKVRTDGMPTYKCNDCGAFFDEPYEKTICWEDEFGVSSLFRDRHYETVRRCPYCDSSDYVFTEEEDRWI